MSPTTKRCFVILIGVALGWAAAVEPAYAQTESRQNSATDGTDTPDPVIDAIGQRMTGESGGMVNVAPKSEGTFPSFGRLVLRMVIATLFTLGALYGGLIALRRVQGQKGKVASSHIRVISRSCLSSKSSVYLVEIAGQTLVIGEGPGGLSLLTTVTDPKELTPEATERTDERLLSPERAQKIKAAVAGFGEQLGLTRRQLGAEQLSKKLREGSRAARRLAGRMGGKSPEPAAGRIDVTQE